VECLRISVLSGISEILIEFMSYIAHTFTIPNETQNVDVYTQIKQYRVCEQYNFIIIPNGQLKFFRTFRFFTRPVKLFYLCEFLIEIIFEFSYLCRINESGNRISLRILIEIQIDLYIYIYV